MVRTVKAVLLAATVIFAAAAHPAEFPTRPVHLIVPSPPGGTLDLLARLLADKLGKGLGGSVIVENRGGAGGVIGSETAAKSAADGYTILLADGSALAINTTLRTDMPIDPRRDLTPLSLVARFPFVLLANNSFPANSVKDVVDLALKDRKAISYASPGVGTPQHLGGAMLASMAKVEFTHVAYRGGGPVLTDLMGGQVPIAFVGEPPALPLIRTGKLKAIAISSRTRSPLLPNVPTIAESGYPNFEAHIWFGCFVPNGVPADIVDKLAKAVNKALSDPELVRSLNEQGVEVIAGSADDLAKYLQSETTKWGALVKSTGAKPE